MLASASVGMMDGYCQEELLDIAHDTLEMWHRKQVRQRRKLHWRERERGKRRPWNWAPRRRLEAQIERLSKRRLHEPAD